MKRLIVNADDFGWSPGINRGIVDAHRRGIVTSASLMVDEPFSEEAARLSAELPRLSVGLHVRLAGSTASDGQDSAGCRTELERQADKFKRLMGRGPTHLDSHHNVHRDPAVLLEFAAMAELHEIPLRGYSDVYHVAGFYGRSDDASYPERISFNGLARILETEVEQAVTELMCHPGYLDQHLRSSYRGEREIELRTLCDRRIRMRLEVLRFELSSFHDVGSRASSSGRAQC